MIQIRLSDSRKALLFVGSLFEMKISARRDSLGIKRHFHQRTGHFGYKIQILLSEKSEDFIDKTVCIVKCRGKEILNK